jgi:glycosyltransferase involved in cell wall biosynthesis
MSLLVMMPQWRATTEAWMHRMLKGLAPHIAALIVNNAGRNKVWNEYLPVYSLDQPPQKIRYVTRGLRVIGLELHQRKPVPHKRLAAIIEKLAPSHILCQYGTYFYQFQEFLAQTQVPLFVHFHGYDATFDLRLADCPDTRYHPEDYLTSLLANENRVTWIANSRFTKSLLVAAGLTAENIRMKYYGFPIPVKQKLHQDRTNIQILHLGRLIDFKSPDRTIQAFEIARSRGLRGRLVMAGDGPLRSYCELLRTRSPYRDSIHMLGAVNQEHTESLFFESDIFTQHNLKGELSRQAECFGASPVEAMAAGLPVVCTKSGGVVESVVDGKTGFLNEPGDIEAQAEDFLRLAEDPELRQKIGDAGRKRVAKCFSPEQETKALCEIMGLSRLQNYQNT